MNRIMKIGVAAIALATVVPTFAQDVEEVDEGKAGWTAVCIGIATPVQLPWGLNKWDVYGLDINLLYSDAPIMYGLDIGGLAALTRETMKGLQVGGLANIAFENVYGMRASLGANICKESVYGFEAGLVGIRKELIGLDVEFLGSSQEYTAGLQIGGLANYMSGESHGCVIAGLANIAPKGAYGLQLALGFNYTEELHGAQIALVNYAYDCSAGFQVGLINIIRTNKIPVLPIVNGYF